MKRRPKSPPNEQAISDGQRYLGRIVPKGNAFEVYDSEGRHLATVDTSAAARSAILRHDRGVDA